MLGKIFEVVLKLLTWVSYNISATLKVLLILLLARAENLIIHILLQLHSTLLIKN